MLSRGSDRSVASPVATGGCLSYEEWKGRPHWSEDATKEIMVELLLQLFGGLL